MTVEADAASGIVGSAIYDCFPAPESPLIGIF